MHDWTFAVSYLSISAAFTLLGLLALFLPPQRYARVVGRLWAAPRREAPVHRSDLQRRLAGLAVAAMGIYLLSGVGSAVRRPNGGRELSALPGSHRLAFGLGFAIFVGGLYILIRPEFLVNWSLRALFAGSGVPQRTLRIWRAVFRTMGVIMMCSSIGLFRLWLQH